MKLILEKPDGTKVVVDQGLSGINLYSAASLNTAPLLKITGCEALALEEATKLVCQVTGDCVGVLYFET